MTALLTPTCWCSGGPLGCTLHGLPRDRALSVLSLYTMLMRREFCYAIKEKYPSCLIQFEDFQTDMVRALVPCACTSPSPQPQAKS